jgi:hypothetical protein
MGDVAVGGRGGISSNHFDTRTASVAREGRAKGVSASEVHEVNSNFGWREVHALQAEYVRSIDANNADRAVAAVDAIERVLLRLEEERHRR